MTLREEQASYVKAADSDAKFRLMFERSADAILLLDTRTNHFVEYNQAALEMLRCSREEMSALHPSELSPPLQPDGQESFKKANAMIATSIRDGSHRFDWIHRSPHREDFPVEVLLTPIPLGDSPTIVVVWRDMTDRRRSEEALRQSQRLESLAVLAGGIAHDFNNLLTAVFGHLHAVRAELTTPVVSAHLDSIEQAVGRAAELTRQMLAYGGKGTFAVEPIDLGTLAREMIGLIGVSIPKHIRVGLQTAREVPSIEADRVQMQQILMNLITNAAEAIGTAEGSIDVTITAAVLDEEAARSEFVGQNIRPGATVVLEVADTGIGMTPEVQSRIFDPFFTTKQSGRGLGLSALRGILSAHCAGVRIRSVPGGGTTFQVHFPAGSTKASNPSGRPSVAAPRCDGTVLLVDDDANVRTSLRVVLQSLGFAVMEASGGAEAIEKFRADPLAIGWVLMDLTMPRMDGHAAFLKLREIDRKVVVVLSSGWAESEVAERFADLPPSAFLPKPFTLQQLRDTIGRLGLESGRGPMAD